MGERGHTKGPWALGEAPYHTDVFGADGFSVADAGSVACLHRDFYAGRMGDGHWATTPGSHIKRDDGQLVANARLIAAAPDMFEALEFARGVLAGRSDRSLADTLAITSIDLAIAKALAPTPTGEASDV